MHPCVHCSFIHNNQDTEVTQIATPWLELLPCQGIRCVTMGEFLKQTEPQRAGGGGEWVFPAEAQTAQSRDKPSLPCPFQFPTHQFCECSRGLY
ncbi:unnamed protein product [Nyctereutes procyonoides]|uniref:(raccoon dog) hypothetical protein n=1 Tax=Nyctereutes procyonoides TaxID=34880 RepID=A0A811ZXW6_NYCPR|nr:unnamed protein product [Nyctereutes procyonoides]